MITPSPSYDLFLDLCMAADKHPVAAGVVFVLVIFGIVGGWASYK